MKSPLPQLPLVVVHGGVDMEDTAGTRATLAAAAAAGHAALDSSGDALDAAVAAVGVLEDDPLFNAGFGSVLTRRGTVETDGGIADGRGRFAGIGAAPGLRHPVRVARRLIEEGDAVLLVGEGASAYANSVGMASEDLRTPEQAEELRLAGSTPGLSLFTGRRIPTETVGCIVVDRAGQIVAASSTGGLLGKRPGRVGDSAVLGAGIWADSSCAVLCSGSGEAAIRAVLAYQVAQRMQAASANDAATWAVSAAGPARRAVTAVLAVDARAGTVGAAHTGASFPVLVVDASGERTVVPVRCSSEVVA